MNANTLLQIILLLEEVIEEDALAIKEYPLSSHLAGVPSDLGLLKARHKQREKMLKECNDDAEQGACSLTLEEAARFLNVSEPFVLDLVAQGGLSAQHIAGHLQINVGDLAAYEKNSRTKQQTALDDMARLSQELGDI